MEATASNDAGGENRPELSVWNAIARRLWMTGWRKAVVEGYDAAADFYDSWEWQALWGHTEWPLLRMLLGKPRTVLEIGIGTGAVANRILLELGGAVDRYVGIDISERMLAHCQARLDRRVELHCADALRYDFGQLGGTFDFVLSCRMLGHIPSPRDLFANIVPVLHAQSVLVVTDIDPGHGYTKTRLPTANGRVEVPTFKHDREAVEQAAERAGLRLISVYRTYEDTAARQAGADAPQSLVGRKGPLSNLFVFGLAPR